MKIYSYINLAALLILTACGGSGKDVDGVIESQNLKKIREVRQEILNNYDELGAQLKKLDKAIALIDTMGRAVPVTTFKVLDTTFYHYIDLQGTVATKQNIVVYPEFSGFLSRIYLNEGQQVKKGQLLAKIDDGGLARQLEQAKTQAALAKTTFDRQKRLWEQNIGSEMQFLQAKATYEAQQELVAQLEAQLSKTNVYAAFDGVVDDVIADEGQVVMTGQTPLFRLVNMDEMYVKADIPENYLPNINKGNEVKVFIPSLNKEYLGKIRQVGNFINPNNRSFSVEIELDNDEKLLKPNQIARLLVNDYTNSAAVLIPETLVKETSTGQRVVYIIENLNVNDATVREAVIVPGLKSGIYLEVLKGLQPGQLVVNEGSKNIEDGQKVTVQNSF